MPTPADAPYKLVQAEHARALRESRHSMRIDRAKLMHATVLAVRTVLTGDPDTRARASRRLRSLAAMLTPAERRALAVGILAERATEAPGA